MYIPRRCISLGDVYPLTTRCVLFPLYGNSRTLDNWTAPNEPNRGQQTVPTRFVFVFVFAFFDTAQKEKETTTLHTKKSSVELVQPCLPEVNCRLRIRGRAPVARPARLSNVVTWYCAVEQLEEYKSTLDSLVLAHSKPLVVEKHVFLAAFLFFLLLFCAVLLRSCRAKIKWLRKHLSFSVAVWLCWIVSVQQSAADHHSTNRKVVTPRVLYPKEFYSSLSLGDVYPQEMYIPRRCISLGDVYP